MRNWVFGVTILVLLVILGLVLFFPVTRVGLGDEVQGFPVKGMSMTVLSWTTESAENISGMAQPDPQIQNVIVLNVSLRNTAAFMVYFGKNDSFNQQLQNGKNESLFLKATYVHPRYGTATIIAPSETSAYDIGWGITITEKPSTLAPNQSINGSLYFFMHAGYTPQTLFCNGTNAPHFTVELNNQTDPQ